MNNQLQQPKPRNQIISYKNLRILIGATGIFLPLLVVIGKYISEGSLELEFSISDYYDNKAGGDVLVGVLFVLGFFLMSYKGYDSTDDRVANIGWMAALGVALFPTTWCGDCWVHYIHFVFAIVLFIVFILFSVWLFRKTDKPDAMTVQKKKRNRIYLICGLIMIVCIAAIPVCIMAWPEGCSKYKLVYWLESLSLVAFGISWITKSESLFLKD